MNVPIDETHAASMNAISRIRERVLRVRAIINEWEPRPCPPDWTPKR